MEGTNKVFSEKSLEGSVAMFFASFLSFVAGLVLFSSIYSFSVSKLILPALIVSIVATLVESVSCRGVDNLTVPILSALTFLAINRGF